MIVIGGGAAGMFSAGTAAAFLGRVLVLEKERRPGRKLRITGKGRCNVTNHCTPREVLENVPTNPRFLYSAVEGFSPEQAMAFFEQRGVPLKEERGNRVFPQSDQAQDIVDALTAFLRERNVQLVQAEAEALCMENGRVQGVRAGQTLYAANRVIVATGGCSYPQTGSTGDGYKLAAQAGHTVVPPVGSLVPLEAVGGCRGMEGLTLRNCGVKLFGPRPKPVFTDFGEVTFFPYGLSGPTILSCSAHMPEGKGPYRICLDLKPALSEKQLDARLLRDFGERQNERLYEGLRKLLPAQMIPAVLDRCGLPADRVVNTVTREERRGILETVKNLPFAIAGKRPVAEAIVTSGGVKVSEVDPKTMESKRVGGLYFAGEVLDVDAYTGGFNLQIAWSTGYAAGIAAGNA